MQDRVWKLIAAVMCVGMFYIGHGLHSPRDSSLPSFENVVHAGGIAWHTDSPELFTASQDGKTVHTWKRFKDVREGKSVVQYIGRTDAPSQRGARPDEGPRPQPGRFPDQLPTFRGPDQQPISVPAPVERKQ
jgi:hypothetical protein